LHNTNIWRVYVTKPDADYEQGIICMRKD